ncbi:hypothetical protein [Quatrionicoccus australiensis]|uniref:hypothetical protein n=1 Tax=Quatrionicoccus australiensis TaxID=138118 RepID=UPI001CF85C17|nr:hypothetical protein [Quatrionicoccus australiensis]UCV13799.1 hypothetical protein KI612_12620 [Quatrionicoccus australiensis]
MIPSTVKDEIKATICVLALVFSFGAGWAVEGWRKDAEIADLKTITATDKSLAANQALARIVIANKRAAQAELQLAAWQTTLTAFAQEKNDELARLVSGRRCLDSAVIRVLNRPGPKFDRALPDAPGLVLRPDGGAAAGSDDGAYSTDADVAGWIELCQRSYNTCRSRLQAIADFYAGEPQ